jgi:putative transposase
VEQLPVHKTRIGRLRREHHLLVPPPLRLHAKRTPSRRTLKPTRLHEWWGIDRPKGPGEGVGWSAIVIGRDGSTTAVVGHDAGLRGTAQHGLEALARAVNHQFPHGARGHGVSRLRDNGCQPTATTGLQACAPVESHQTFTTDNNPQGHADTERFRRTRKEEGLWLHEWTGPLAFVRAVDKWRNADKTHELHAALGYNTPRPFERDDDLSHRTPCVAA